jgi:HlyD family secretion protein
MYKKRKFDIHTDEVNDILGRAPEWFVRSGSVIVFSLMVLLIFLSSVIRYPDVIEARAVLTSVDLPVKLRARSSGRLERIVVEDKNMVQKGDVIAMIENGAVFEDYLSVRKICDSYPDFPAVIKGTFSLGSMQDAYGVFVGSHLRYELFVNSNYHGKMLESLDKERALKERHLELLQEKRSLMTGKSELVQADFARDSVLFSSGVISESEMQLSYSEYIDFEKEFKEIDEAVVDLEMQLVKLEQKSIELSVEKNQESLRLKEERDNSYELLKSVMSLWERKNLIVAPESGMLSYTSFWQEHQNVSENDVVFTVIPQHESGIIAKISIPLQGAGKVKVGQGVNLRLDNFPYMEFGVLKAVVTKLPELPSESASGIVYTAEAALVNGMETTYGEELEFRQELHSTARIITSDISIMKRILYPVRHLLNSNM